MLMGRVTKLVTVIAVNGRDGMVTGRRRGRLQGAGRTIGFPLAHVDDDGLGEAILGAHAIRTPEILQEAEGAFDGLPLSEARTDE